MTKTSVPNPPAAGVPYYLPRQDIVAGTATGENPPKLFTPLKISENLTVPNRIGVAPMCMYLAENGEVTLFHFQHYVSIALRGPGFVMVEASAVAPEGRITPQDVGIWNDTQAEKLKQIVDHVHAIGGKIGIQIAHAGRKASTAAPFRSMTAGVAEDVGGWPDQIVGASAISFNGEWPTPHELTVEEIHEKVQQFAAAAKRAVNIAGFDFVEIHSAHGYLFNLFMSETSNKRTDQYGGSFENRSRIVLETVDAVKKAVPSTPIFLRFSAVENVPGDEHAWTIEDSVKLAPILVEHGVSFLDISSGGNSNKQHARGGVKAVHAPLSKAVKAAVGDSCIVATVGNVDSAELAEEVLSTSCDFVLVGRGFLKNPGLVWTWADELKVKVAQPGQYTWGIRVMW